MTPPNQSAEQPPVALSKGGPARGTKFLLAWLGSFLVCCFWFLREWQGHRFHLQGEGGLLEVQMVTLVASILMLVAVTLISGLIAIASLEVDRWRLVVQGVTVPGVLIALAMDKVPASQIVNGPPPTKAQQSTGTVPNPHAFAGLSLIAAAYAQPPSVTPVPSVDPPDFFTKLGWGLRTLRGGYAANWYVEVGRYAVLDQAEAAAKELAREQLPATPYELCFAAAGPDASAWLPCGPDRTGVHVEYAVLLGANVSPEDARRLKAAAEKAGITSRAWQRPQPALPLPVPGDLPVDKPGAHLVRQRGANVEIALDYSYAASHTGADWLVLRVALAGSLNNGASIRREAIGVVRPDGQTLPLATQQAFAAGQASLAPKLRAASVASGPVHEYLRGQLEDCGWYQAESGGLLVVDELHVRPGTACAGFLAFQVPGGVTRGSWRLVVDLPGGPLRVPFEIE